MNEVLQRCFFCKFLIKFLLVVSDYELFVFGIMKLIVEFLASSRSTFFHVAKSWREILVSSYLLLEHLSILLFLHSCSHRQHSRIQLALVQSSLVTSLHLFEHLRGPPQFIILLFFLFSQPVNAKKTVSVRNRV